MGNLKENALVKADCVILNDNLSSEILQKLMNIKVFAPEKVIISADQIVPPNTPEHSGIWSSLIKLADMQGIRILLGQAMTSEIVMKNITKGQVVVSVNPDVAAAGAVGAYGIQVSEEQIVEILKNGMIETPAWTEKIICLEGSLPHDSMATDAALMCKKTIGKLTSNILLNIIVHSNWSNSEKSIFSIFMKQTGAGCVTFVDDNQIMQTTAVEKITVNLSDVEPMAASANSYDALCVLNSMEGEAIKAAYIGGSAGGSFENIETAVKILKGKKIAYGVRFSVSPASAEIYNKIANAGYINDILDAGGLVLNQCADPEIQCRLGENETLVSCDWKNTSGYAGFENSKTIIASAKTVAEAALTGKLSSEKSNATDVEESEKSEIVLEGRCWKFGDDIDTDIIIPTQWVCVPVEEMVKHAFEPLRPELASQFKDGDIIVAGDNFGCGSSREMAAEVIVKNGVRCIIAKSFARIFFRNAINNGILLIECPDFPDEVNEGDIVRVELNTGIICNEKTYHINKIPENLYAIISDGGLVKNIEKKVKGGLL